MISKAWDFIKDIDNRNIYKRNYQNDQMVGGGCCGDGGSTASDSPIVGSLGGIVSCMKGGACDGSGGLREACSGADIIPR